MDVVTETDSLEWRSAFDTAGHYPLSESFFNDLFQTCKGSTENKEHIGCIDGVHIPSLRTAAV